MSLLLKKELVSAAKAAADWLVKNQVIDELDANYGRFLYCCNLETGYSEKSTGWQTGVGIIALLWMNTAEKNESYLKAAERAARYVLSLQVLESESPHQFGTFREETPQTQWMHPRDGVSVAWGLLCLYSQTSNDIYLRAARRYADWHLANAWHKSWPVATVQLGPNGRTDSKIQANCQGGTAGFFLQLARVTGDYSYSQQGAKPILDYYIAHFLEPSGKPHVLYCPETDSWDTEKPHSPVGGEAEDFGSGWLEMHRYNDDFSAISLLQGYLELGDRQYLKAAGAYADWLASTQNPDGGFGTPTAEAGSSCVPLFLLDYAAVEKTDKYEDVISRAVSHLLKLQIKSDVCESNGGFLCLDNLCRNDSGKWVNIRNTSYGIAALLKTAGFCGPAFQACC